MLQSFFCFNPSFCCFSDRGLKFERFVAGPHGAREVDLEGVEKHAKALEDAGVLSDEDDDDDDEDDDSEEDEGDKGVQAEGGVAT